VPFPPCPDLRGECVHENSNRFILSLHVVYIPIKYSDVQCMSEKEKNR